MTKSLQVNVHEAKSTLSELLKRAEDGDEVIIARRGQPVARLVPVRSGRGLPHGVLKGQIVIGPDFDAPLPDDMAEVFGG